MIFILVICHQLVRLLSLLIIINALLSWFPGARQSKLGGFVEDLVDPIIRPIRRFGLQFAGLDFSPILALFLLQFLDRVIIYLSYSF